MMRRLAVLVLALSLAAFLARAVIYLPAGSYGPLAFILAVLALLLAARFIGRGAGRIAVRIWGVVLVIYGVGRLGLAGLLALAPISSPHALASTGWIFALMSVLYLGAGLCLVLVPRDTGSARPAGSHSAASQATG